MHDQGNLPTPWRFRTLKFLNPFLQPPIFTIGAGQCHSSGIDMRWQVSDLRKSQNCGAPPPSPSVEPKRFSAFCARRNLGSIGWALKRPPSASVLGMGALVALHSLLAQRFATGRPSDLFRSLAREDASSTNQQASALTSVTSSLGELDGITQRNAQMATMFMRAVKELRTRAEDLSVHVAYFVFSDGDDDRAADCQEWEAA